MTEIKICGIRDAHTLQQTCALEPDYIGFVYFADSVRHVDMQPLAALVSSVPTLIKSVVVTVEPDDEFLTQLFGHCKPDYLQLHGHETTERASEIKFKYNTKIIKSVAVAEAADLAMASDFIGVADAMLFDTKLPTGISGGSGAAFDWNLMRSFSLPVPWFLSGGLSPDNVSHALTITQAPAVDVSSHVESPPKSGAKDLAKIGAFIRAVRCV